MGFYRVFFCLLMMAGMIIPRFAAGQENHHYVGYTAPAIIPAPVSYVADTSRTFMSGNILKVVVPESEFNLAVIIADFFRDHPSLDALVQVHETAIKYDIECRFLHQYDAVIGKEGYHLNIGTKGISITANTSAGLFYGFQTLKQIILTSDSQDSSVLLLPFMKITDYPAFTWRSMLLDCCRHFMEKDFILRYLDLLAFYKMNIFHWHLTEDQAWRAEIEKYPLLTEVGAWRRHADGTLYGGYYTKEEMREVVAYASKRHITVVPEIEMPGHAMAALAAYPSLSCTNGPFEVPSTWGVFKDIYCAGNDSVFIFLKDILDEVMEIFPSEYIHIGGDEVPKFRWKQCAKCQQRIADLKLKDEHELQGWFIGQIADHLQKNNRRLIGWEEIIEGGLAESAIVQSWKGFDGAVHAAASGHRTIVTPTSHGYFDYPVHKITLEKVYSFSPIPAGLDPSLHHYILGGGCNIWTEHAPQELVDQKVFPRLLAMAEALWSHPVHRDFTEFRNRARQHYPVLAALGVNYGLEKGGVTIVTQQTPEGILVTLIPEQDNITVFCGTHPSAGQPLFRYTAPLLITDSMDLVAAAFMNEKRVSELYHRRFNIHPGTGLPYKLSMKPGSTYNKDPETTLTDGIRGTSDFHDGLWLGFWEHDPHIRFRFKEARSISKVNIGFLQSNPSWIFLPEQVTMTVRPKGFWKRKIRLEAVSLTPKETILTQEDFSFLLKKPIHAKKITIHVKNPGKCPDWHPGAGSPTWVFVDEIEIY